MSRRKGNAYENRIKKIFARWWGEPEHKVGTKESAFQRSPGSGGMSPVNWPLDIHVPSDFPWAIECKNREGNAGLEKMERFFTGNYPVVQWFVTAELELLRAGINKPLLLVFSKNRFLDLVALREPQYADIGMDHDVFSNCLILRPREAGNICVVPLKRLLDLSPSEWKRVYGDT